MGTKNDPGPYNCLDQAEPDEPIFVLLGRDADAPQRVYDWAMQRIARGELEKGAEALQVAKNMRAFRIARRKRLESETQNETPTIIENGDTNDASNKDQKGSTEQTSTDTNEPSAREAVKSVPTTKGKVRSTEPSAGLHDTIVR